MRTVLVVPPDGAPYAEQVPRVDLDHLKGWVGGWVEHVGLNFETHDALYCNEEGLLLRLAPNPVAQTLALRLLHPDIDPSYIYLVGTVVFITDGPDGDDGSVRDAVLDLVGLA